MQENAQFTERDLIVKRGRELSWRGCVPWGRVVMRYSELFTNFFIVDIRKSVKLFFWVSIFAQLCYGSGCCFVCGSPIGSFEALCNVDVRWGLKQVLGWRWCGWGHEDSRFYPIALYLLYIFSWAVCDLPADYWWYVCLLGLKKKIILEQVLYNWKCEYNFRNTCW